MPIGFLDRVVDNGLNISIIVVLSIKCRLGIKVPLEAQEVELLRYCRGWNDLI